MTRHGNPYPMRFLFFLTTALAFLALLLIFSNTSGARIISVEEDGSGEFTDLQEALDSSNDGDIIQVGPGYYPGPFNVTKQVTINSTDGPNSTFLFPKYYENDGYYLMAQSHFPDSLLSLIAENVTIQGFTLSSLPANVELNDTEAMAYQDELTHIMLGNTSGYTISDNLFVRHPRAIELGIVRNYRYTTGIQTHEIRSITDLIIENNTVQTISTFIDISDIDRAVIRNNIITCNSTLSYRNYPIKLEFVANTEFSGNTITNTYSAISITSGMIRSVIHNNTFTSNMMDIVILKNCVYATISDNVFNNDQYNRSSVITIVISLSHSFIISNNTFTNRSMLLLQYLDNVTLTNNILFSTDLRIESVSNFTASGNTLDGKEILIITQEKDTSYDLTDVGRVFIIESVNVTIQNLVMEDATYGMSVINSRAIIILNSTFTRSGVAGIYLEESDNCIISDCTFIDGYYGIYLSKSLGGHITKSLFTNNLIGVYLKESNLTTLSDSTLTGGERGVHIETGYFCIIESCNLTEQDYGIKSHNSRQVYIFMNNLTDTALSAIYVFGGEDIHIKKNTINGAANGIEVLTCIDSEIMDNEVTGYTNAGLTLNSSSDRNEISGNSFNGPGNSAYGIYIIFSNYNDIFYNAISDHGFGIFLENATRNNITGNSISENVQGFYFVATVFRNLIQNNSITGNTIGANAEFSRQMVDMSWNYWGSDTGPHHPINNTHGLGDRVTVNITFSPFQLFLWEPIPEPVQQVHDDDEYMWGYTRSQFLIRVVDLAIAVLVGGLFLLGFREQTNSKKDTGQNKEKKTTKKKESEKK